MDWPTVSRPPVLASTTRAEMAIFPGVACRKSQNSTTATAGKTQLTMKSTGPPTKPEVGASKYDQP